MLGLNRFEDSIHVIHIRNVTLYGLHVLSNRRDRLIQLRLPASRYENKGALFNKKLSARQADATVAARYDGHFSIESVQRVSFQVETLRC